MTEHKDEYDDKPDARGKESLAVGDCVAMLFFGGDDKYNKGTLELIGGELGIPIGKDSVGLVSDAYHVVKIRTKVNPVT